MKRHLFLLIFAALLTACGIDETPSPTLIPSSPVSSASPTVLPTLTPTETTSPGYSPPTATLLSPTPTPTVPMLKRIGQIGGASKAVAVQDQYVYFNAGPRLVILDVADPVHPAVVGQSFPLPGFESLAVAKDHAYVAAGEGGLRVINVSDPAVPIEVGSYATSGPAWSIVAIENAVYVAAEDGLHILDISNPTAPTGIGFYDTPDAALDVTVVGNTVYIAEIFSQNDDPAERGGLRVVDVSDPTNPSEIGFYSMNPSQVGEFERPNAPRGVRGVAVAGGYAYLTYRTERRGGLRIVDVSDPVNPHEIGDYQDYIYFVSDVTVVRNPLAGAGRVYAYVATGVNFGLLVLDLSDPTQPVALTDNVSGPARDLVLAGNTLFVADERGGLHIADISDPAHAFEVSFYDTLGDARDVVVAGHTAYVTDGLRDLWVVDVLDPAQPVQVGVYTAPGNIEDVVVVGTTVYIAAETAGLLMVDVSNPVHPTQVSAYDTPGLAYGVAVSGDYAYIADGQLQVLDVSDPVAPAPVAVYESPVPIRDLVVAGNAVYFASDGLYILDISDPVHPADIGFHAMPGKSGEVAVAGDYAYLVVKNELHVMDVSNQAQPFELSELNFYDEPVYARHVTMAGNYVYVVCEGRLHLVDVSDPASPKEAMSYDAHKFANGIAVAGDRVYVADGAEGLVIYFVRLESA